MRTASRQLDVLEMRTLDSAAAAAPAYTDHVRHSVNPPRIVHFHDLFRFASKRDWVIIALGSLCALTKGSFRPLLMLAVGNVTATFRQYHVGKASAVDFLHEIAESALLCCYLGLAILFTSYTASAAFVYTGQSISDKIRAKYMHSILRQDIEYFEVVGAGKIAMRAVDKTEAIQCAISERVPEALTRISTLLASCTIGLTRNWRLSLILLSGFVPSAAAVAAARVLVKRLEQRSETVTDEAASFVGEVFANIENTMAFGTQEKLTRRFNDRFASGISKASFRADLAMYMSRALNTTVSFFIIALGFWQGNRYIVSGQASISEVVTIVLIFSIGVRSASGFGASVRLSAAATTAARDLYDVIDGLNDRKIDGAQSIIPSLAHGQGVAIEFCNVNHAYASYRRVTVLQDLSLRILPGKLTAIIGPSGSGKSTLIGLIQRFYEPSVGQILFGNHDLRSIDVCWLRNQCALVSQEPFLFEGTVTDNVRYGLHDACNSMSEKDIREKVEQACRLAEAHDFVMQLPELYDTQVGRRGDFLSVGQRQRIAIARAVVGEPKVLLLDEPCSALDAENARAVEASILNAAQGRTTIMVAHHLETIRHADDIIVMNSGSIVEQGTHADLIKRPNGTYRALVERQGLTTASTPEKLESRARQRHRARPRRNVVSTEDKSPTQAENRETHSQGQEARRRPQYQSQPSSWTLNKFVARLGQKDLVYIVLHLVACSAIASLRPIAAIFFANCIASLARPASELHRSPSALNLWCGMYTVLAGAAFAAYSVSGISAALGQNRLVRRARGLFFHLALRQDSRYFETHAPISLTLVMMGDMKCLGGLSAIGLSPTYTGISSLLLYLVLALANAWKLALVCASPIPVVLGMVILRKRVLPRFRRQMNVLYQTPAAFLGEVCTASAMKTVVSLACEKRVEEQYLREIKTQGAKLIRGRQKNALTDAGAESLTFFCMALAIWYGGQLVAGKDHYTIKQVFICVKALTLGMQELAAGRLSSHDPQIRRGRRAAAQLRTLTLRSPEIDVSSACGGVPEQPWPLSIKFCNLSFRYSSRSDWVIKDFNLEIQPGQHVAFVGSSGCGKSTLIALLERFYDPQEGKILVHGKDIKEYNLVSYRSALSLVSQEAKLYQTTIRENLLLGLESNTIPESELVQACKDASVYGFLMSLPDGLDTAIGTHGSTLSGGQKQRLSIARALLRKPRLLLLDEATAALDQENENAVKAALDLCAANRTRTTITVTHRLNTVRNADVICVVDGGSVLECGSFDDLWLKRGAFWEMARLQNVQNDVVPDQCEHT
ncbi:hypothetical protein AC579_2064 [Pseudocercospora musae]|uniref:ABC transporter domain-containing protein n=1 Tax=Pseudocercospora musae TaxID=113226 RepID=A0A139IFZ3_9PEZI|nr:hypothetical protein AC579_2064 [Pseudocercospora musae]